MSEKTLPVVSPCSSASYSPSPSPISAIKKMEMDGGAKNSKGSRGSRRLPFTTLSDGNASKQSSGAATKNAGAFVAGGKVASSKGDAFLRGLAMAVTESLAAEENDESVVGKRTGQAAASAPSTLMPRRIPASSPTRLQSDGPATAPSLTLSNKGGASQGLGADKNNGGRVARGGGGGGVGGGGVGGDGGSGEGNFEEQIAAMKEMHRKEIEALKSSLDQERENGRKLREVAVKMTETKIAAEGALSKANAALKEANKGRPGPDEGRGGADKECGRCSGVEKEMMALAESSTKTMCQLRRDNTLLQEVVRQLRRRIPPKGRESGGRDEQSSLKNVEEGKEGAHQTPKMDKEEHEEEGQEELQDQEKEKEEQEIAAIGMQDAATSPEPSSPHVCGHEAVIDDLKNKVEELTRALEESNSRRDGFERMVGLLKSGVEEADEAAINTIAERDAARESVVKVVQAVVGLHGHVDGIATRAGGDGDGGKALVTFEMMGKVSSCLKDVQEEARRVMSDQGGWMTPCAVERAHLETFLAETPFSKAGRWGAGDGGVDEANLASVSVLEGGTDAVDAVPVHDLTKSVNGEGEMRTSGDEPSHAVHGSVKVETWEGSGQLADANATVEGVAVGDGDAGGDRSHADTTCRGADGDGGKGEGAGVGCEKMGVVVEGRGETRMEMLKINSTLAEGNELLRRLMERGARSSSDGGDDCGGESIKSDKAEQSTAPLREEGMVFGPGGSMPHGMVYHQTSAQSEGCWEANVMNDFGLASSSPPPAHNDFGLASSTPPSTQNDFGLASSSRDVNDYGLASSSRDVNDYGLASSSRDVNDYGLASSSRDVNDYGLASSSSAADHVFGLIPSSRDVNDVNKSSMHHHQHVQVACNQDPSADRRLDDTATALETEMMQHMFPPPLAPDSLKACVRRHSSSHSNFPRPRSLSGQSLASDQDSFQTLNVPRVSSSSSSASASASASGAGAAAAHASASSSTLHPLEPSHPPSIFSRSSSSQSSGFHHHQRHDVEQGGQSDQVTASEGGRRSRKDSSSSPVMKIFSAFSGMFSPAKAPPPPSRSSNGTNGTDAAHLAAQPPSTAPLRQPEFTCDPPARNQMIQMQQQPALSMPQLSSSLMPVLSSLDPGQSRTSLRPRSPPRQTHHGGGASIDQCGGNHPHQHHHQQHLDHQRQQQYSAVVGSDVESMQSLPETASSMSLKPAVEWAASSSSSEMLPLTPRASRKEGPDLLEQAAEEWGIAKRHQQMAGMPLAADLGGDFDGDDRGVSPGEENKRRREERDEEKRRRDESNERLMEREKALKKANQGSIFGAAAAGLLNGLRGAFSPSPKRLFKSGGSPFMSSKSPATPLTPHGPPTAPRTHAISGALLFH